MLITRLKLTGFKSFVDATELVIEPGLTGVVGPNGCGKSNLLEALRWVMGETSHKSMRASSMDDVIFAGTTARPARNVAEVTIAIDNRARRAPAEFNDADQLEITRRIEREHGSSYRVNHRDVRARDIRILFEDAATGARSPALVRQGQIGEIVNAKPEQRRRILEDAAGVAGLHSRRHDAELRLKAAEANLARIDDILGQMTSQIEQLKRQARQARRYRDMSAEIARAEAAVLFLAWFEAQREVDAAEAEMKRAQSAHAAAAESEARATAHEAEASAALDPLRKREAEASAALARLGHERTVAERDRDAARVKLADLKRQHETVVADLEREAVGAREAVELSAAKADEIATLTSELTHVEAASRDTAAAADVATEALKHLERALADEQAAVFELRSEAEKRRLKHGQITAQLADTEAAIDANTSDVAALERDAPDGDAAAAAAARLADANASLVTAEEAARDLAERSEEAARALEAARTDAREASAKHNATEAERAALARLLAGHKRRDWQPILDEVSVAEGFEKALAAAFGGDLEAGGSPTDPMRWCSGAGDVDGGDAPSWPDGVKPLADFVEAPAQLARALCHIGVVVDPSVAPHPSDLLGTLKPGQSLASTDGNLWRWDGFVAEAGARQSGEDTERLLVERNRLKTLTKASKTLKSHADQADAMVADRARQHQEVTAARHTADGAVRAALKTVANAEKDARACAHAQAVYESRKADLAARANALKTRLSEQRDALAAIDAEIAAEPDLAPLKAALDRRAEETAAARARAQELQVSRSDLTQKLDYLKTRAAAAQSERARWEARQARAEEQITALGMRKAEIDEALATADAAPGEADARLETLRAAIAEAETARAGAADELASGEAALRQASGALKEAREASVATREARVRVETRLEAARGRRVAAVRDIEADRETSPEACAREAGIDPSAPDITLPEAERRLQKLRADRERIGGVNLDAERDLAQIEAEAGSLANERADVDAAIAKLRGAIGKLNREGRQRLLDAFESVNAQFASLFETLFGGGEARLAFVESDDPLEGGLEIVAKPPGKKPTTLSLLSGGEQTLTALSLIFAVFLTNPSPICVLDEVDAPLDDANVDRFCTLMESMAERTATRFLVITHHPMTMARMNRLFGVTMAERGVSQLVSVDLEVAERFLEAG